jgi:hypothetical protein
MKDKRWLALLLLILVGGIELYVWKTGVHRSATQEGAAEDPALVYLPHLKPGEQVTEFVAENLEGGTRPIGYPADGKKTILAIVSVTCDMCAENVPMWNRMARELGDRANMYAIVLGDYQQKKGLLREEKLEFPAVRFPNRETAEEYKAFKVPQTIVVGPGGRVEDNLIGVLTEAQIGELVARATADDGISS